MKVTSTAPEWAVKLVTRICTDHKRALPKKFQWYSRRSEQHSCGHVRYLDDKLHVAAGREVWQHRPVLLHELSHWLLGKTSKGRRAGHNTAFWKLFWQLSMQHGDIAESYQRDVVLAREWRPGTRAKAVATYDLLPIEKA